MSKQTTSVKAWIFTTTSYPETLHQGNYEIPSTPPNSTSIILKPHASSLNPVDIQLMNLPVNNLPSYTPKFGSFAGPKIPGRDFSGTVLAAGSSSGFKPGDEVMGINMGIPGTGFLAEAVSLDCAPGLGATVIQKPPQLSWTQAASLPCVYLTARTSIEKCLPFLKNPTPAANKIAILGGSSATGIYTVKLAKERGWTVLSSCSSRNTQFVRGLGADETVDYTSSPTAVVDAVRKFKPDAIIDNVGGTETIGLARQYVTIVGDKTSRATMGGPALYLTHPRMLLRWLLGYLGVVNSYECIHVDAKAEWLEDVRKLNGGEGEGEQTGVYIDSVFEFDKVKEAFERLDTGRARGKVVVKVAD